MVEELEKAFSLSFSKIYSKINFVPKMVLKGLLEYSVFIFIFMKSQLVFFDKRMKKLELSWAKLIFSLIKIVDEV